MQGKWRYGIILIVLWVSLLVGSAWAETYWDCTASGMEKNGDRKVDLHFRLDGSGNNILSGEISFAKTGKDKNSFPGGQYLYAGGSKLTRDDATYEWIMEGNWVSSVDNTDNGAKKQGTVMVRKYKLQNIAEMQMKSKDGSIWFVFPHGCEYKQVTVDDKDQELK